MQGTTCLVPFTPFHAILLLTTLCWTIFPQISHCPCSPREEQRKTSKTRLIKLNCQLESVICSNWQCYLNVYVYGWLRFFLIIGASGMFYLKQLYFCSLSTFCNLSTLNLYSTWAGCILRTCIKNSWKLFFKILPVRYFFLLWIPVTEILFQWLIWTLPGLFLIPTQMFIISWSDSEQNLISISGEIV